MWNNDWLQKLYHPGQPDYIKWVMYNGKECPIMRFNNHRVFRVEKANVTIPDYIKWKAKKQIMADAVDRLLVLVSAL